LYAKPYVLRAQPLTSGLPAGAMQVGSVSASLRPPSLTLSKVSITSPEHLGHHTCFRAERIVLRPSLRELWHGAHARIGAWLISSVCVHVLICQALDFGGRLGGLLLSLWCRQEQCMGL